MNTEPKTASPHNTMDIATKLQEKVENKLSGKIRIKDARVFDYDYVPDQPVWRAEMDPLLESIAEYSSIGLQNHAIITGPRGSGKTVFMQYLARLLPDKYGLRVLYANCRASCDTTYKLLAKFLGRIPRGYAQGDHYAEFKARFNEKTLVILDEADYLSRQHDPNKEIFYFLSRETRTMVVALSNNKLFINQLDEATRTTLQPEIIDFRPYDTPTILEILRQRAELGLADVPDEILRRIAALTHEDANADVRVAIRTLRLWAMRSERPVEECFQKAWEQIYLDSLRSLNTHQLAILVVIADSEGQPMKELYHRYTLKYRELQKYGRFYSYVTFLAAVNLLWTHGLILLTPARVGKANTSHAELTFDRKILDHYYAHFGR